jgi:hypothetical protein
MSLKYQVLRHNTRSRYLIYLRHGQYHREDGPAFVYSDGDMTYYQYNNLHRTDGPAVIHPSEYTIEYHFRGTQQHVDL